MHFDHLHISSSSTCLTLQQRFVEELSFIEECDDNIDSVFDCLVAQNPTTMTYCLTSTLSDDFFMSADTMFGCEPLSPSFTHTLKLSDKHINLYHCNDATYDDTT